MGFPLASGAVNYSTNKFIPEIWASKLIQNFYDATVFGEIANTDYEGDIKGMGDTVNIRATPDMTIRDYQKGMTLQVERPDKAGVTLVIDQGKYFSAIEDDVDKVQTDINMLDTWTKDASEKMKVKIDSDVLAYIATGAHASNSGATAGRISAGINLGVSGTPVQLTRANILDYIVDLGTVLDEQNITETGRWIVLPAWACGLIKKSDLKDASLSGDSQSVLRNGKLGTIDRFTLYSSNNVKKSADSSGSTAYNIMAGHKSAVTFASQMTEMETLRAESTFGNIVRGLQVYGRKVVLPNALALLYAKQ